MTAESDNLRQIVAGKLDVKGRKEGSYSEEVAVAKMAGRTAWHDERSGPMHRLP
jgi:hypothetical protein